MHEAMAHSDRAGFPVTFDGQSGLLHSESPLRFNRAVRTKADVSKVLLDGEEINDSTELYWIFQLADAGQEQEVFDAIGVTYACVLLPSMKIGREFVKTQGHYHPPMPGTTIQYPEVYSHLFGEIYLYLQRRRDERPTVVDDCVLIDMREWSSVTIPPGYAHVLINPSSAPAAIAGLYASKFKPDYLPFVELGGAAHYLIDDNGERFIPNQRYEQSVPVRRPEPGSEQAFVAPDGEGPLWSSFLENPESYAFVANSDAAMQKFGDLKEPR
jgi:glucose-6-phosphate isomerase